MYRRDFLPVLLQSRHLFQADIGFLGPDLTIPEVTDGPPRPGVRVRIGTSDLYHILYLPKEWQVNGRYPLIVEYPGNAPGPLSLRTPGVRAETGAPEDTKLGYGISGGAGFLWLSLPFVDQSRNRIASSWWGDAQDTVNYCLQTVLSVCSDFGGDSARILLCGFSRGSIACNYIGLYNDSIAALWRGFVCHSHYDGVHRWPYPGSDAESALQRLQRLKGRPQFISHESSGDKNGLVSGLNGHRRYVGSLSETRRYIESTKVDGDFTFQVLPYQSHTDAWVLRNIVLRDTLRLWVRRLLT